MSEPRDAHDWLWAIPLAVCAIVILAVAMPIIVLVGGLLKAIVGS